MSKPEFDKFAEIYDDVLNDSIPLTIWEDTYFSEYKVALTASFFDRSPPNSVLDFGCGAGRSLPYLLKYFSGSRIIGYDPSPESLKIAKRRSPNTPLYCDWSAIHQESFGLIFAANVFHHISSDSLCVVLDQCKAALASDGALIIFEHNPFNPATRWVFERCPFDAEAEMISKKRLKRLAAQVGLRTVDEGYTLFFPRPLGHFRPIEKHLAKIPLGAQYYVRLEK